MAQETETEAGPAEADLERLADELKAQVRRAKDRIADRYTRLVEERPFAKPADRKG